MISVLFVCAQNSARSQMAAALLKNTCSQHFNAESAGIEPGELNPLAVASMQELGIDISQNTTQAVFDLFKAGRLYSFVITVCDDATAERCPIFPGISKRLHWSIPDPAELEGPWDSQLAAIRDIRDAISQRIEAFCQAECLSERSDRQAILA